jgi:hypothetical protein
MVWVSMLITNIAEGDKSSVNIGNGTKNETVRLC